MGFLHRNRTAILVTVGLVSLTLVCYFPICAADVDFVNFDDGDYFVENKHVQAGLTHDSVVWALTTFQFGNWHPLTWLSLQLDTELFGFHPAVYHRVNVALHIANVVLLFVTLDRMTGVIWPSALVAALFGVHPLHVESVAWVTERKDVLSTFFWMLTMLAYSHYASRPSTPRLLVVIVSFALGLMAKQMLVTLPCVLFLLDFWPLRRLRRWSTSDSAARFPPVSLRQLIWEKVPLLLLAWLGAEMTLAAQRPTSLEELSFERRAANVVEAYSGYLAKTAWPTKLVPLYPYPDELPPWWKISLSVLLLAGVTWFTIRQIRQPYLLIGWLWFLGTLVPVIGLVHVGRQSMADRYTYIPLIGVFIAVAWGCGSFATNRTRKIALAASGAVIVVVCVSLTREQVRIWHNGISLWAHCVRVNERVPIYHQNLGRDYALKKQYEAAERQFRRATELNPDSAEARFQLSAALRHLGRLEEAKIELSKALKIRLKEGDEQP